MIKITRQNPHGDLIINPDSKVFGRSVYLCYNKMCIENALKKISEIDILSDRGIIICERPDGKLLEAEIPGLTCSKEYRYGKTRIAVYRKTEEET